MNPLAEKQLLLHPEIRAALRTIRANLKARGYPMEMMQESHLLRGVLQAGPMLNFRGPTGGELRRAVATVTRVAREATRRPTRAGV